MSKIPQTGYSLYAFDRWGDGRILGEHLTRDAACQLYEHWHRTYPSGLVIHHADFDGRPLDPDMLADWEATDE